MGIDFSPATAAIGTSIADVQAFLIPLVMSLVGLMFVVGGVVWLLKKVMHKTVGTKGANGLGSSPKRYYPNDTEFPQRHLDW